MDITIRKKVKYSIWINGKQHLLTSKIEVVNKLLTKKLKRAKKLYITIEEV